MTHKLRKLCLLFLSLVLVLGTVLSLNISNVKAADQSNNGNAKLVIGTLKNTSAMPLIMADSSGAFSKNNITAEVKVYNSNKELNQAVKDGSINFATTDLVNYAAVSKSNKDWKVMGTLPGYHGLVANKKYSKVKNLKGKTIAIDKKDSSKQYLKAVLKKNKLKYSSIKVKQIDAASERVSALNDKKIAAAVVEDPYISQAKGTGNKILNCQKMNADNGNVMITNKKFANSNTSSTNILVDVVNDEISKINKMGYAAATPALQKFEITDEKSAKYITDLDVSFKKMHRVKKSDFNKAFKYAKAQKLYKGKISYKKSFLKVKEITNKK
ncbi:hypothetical protein D1B17_10615 [Companilactobacillus zhachilii]|uniref:Solute-binding protein family 3/N-terminal domain-containing protein n=1 Tax=Companilactobacillus zhachilii TaxID=2304606 RepID=A0A386PSR2_9LACO|nr:ABC transporter substrate-binding protein [Companilactobacillus zhachilii]AYE39056.1 hypothetical protein D1B17_10615 [Companilactobacillus zhachilii]